MTGRTHIGRRGLLTGAIAATGTALLPATRAEARPTGEFRSVPKQLQVFRMPAEGWAPVAQLCRRMGISQVSIALSPVERRTYLNDNRAGIAAFAPLLDSGLRVSCLVGDTAWLVNPPSGLPAELIESIHINDKVFRFEALILDVEPQAAPGWATAGRGDIVRNTLALFAETRAACRLYDVKTVAALSPLFAQVANPARRGESLLDSCLAQLDAVVLTTYRNEPDAAIAYADAALQRRPIPTWFSVTTQLSARPEASYYGLGLARFEKDVAELHARLRTLPQGRAVAGIAIHQFESLRRLAQA